MAARDLTRAPGSVVLALVVAGVTAVAGRQDVPFQPPAARANLVFEQWNRRDAPGCVVAVGQSGRVVFRGAYGMANLEHNAPLTPQTIFEAGSVSKQFTAAAVILLALDGKLSLDDPVRKYLPEVPDFGGEPIRIRHLLTHTSGLRSQWPLLTIAGRPPGSAVHTVNEILDLVNRQKELNFPPGDESLYNNTAFTLLSVVVARVSGQSFQEFSEARLFKPIGMTSTRWRDDHARVVKGRATAYSGRPREGRGQAGRKGDTRGEEFRTDMSFTDVVGNGGLLTTVGDLMLWNQNLDTGKVGGRRMVEELETRGTLNDGFVTDYARGLYVLRYRGLREVSHGGSTAGYCAYLGRFPEKQFSVAVLCNVASATPDVYAHQLVDIFLAGHLEDRRPAPAARVAPDELRALAGLYREPSTDAVERITYDKDRLRVGVGVGGAELSPIGPGRFRNDSSSAQYVFESSGDEVVLQVVDPEGGSKPRSLVRVPAAEPSAADLVAYTGVFSSEELDIRYIVGITEGRLFALHRPGPGILLRPLYADAFDFGQGRVIRFTRDQAGRVAGFQVYAGRVRHLKFVKMGEP